MIEPDLQDVVVGADERVFTSTFKRAELLEVGSGGSVLSRRRPDDLQGPFFGPFAFGMKEQHLQPAVAWSALRAPDGGVAIVHQRAQTDMVEISHEDEGIGGDGDSEDGDGGSYGGGAGGCDAIVQNGVTFMGADGEVNSLPPIAGMVLPVDGAISRDGRWLAIAIAGNDPNGQNVGFLGEAPGTVVIDTSVRPPPDSCVVPGFEVPGAMVGSGQTIGVDFDQEGRLVVQTREPNMIRVYSDFDGCGLNFCASSFDVAMGGEPTRDTGHDLFHMDAGRGISCASCHPGGGDDGRTWLFSGLGPRRTQLFNMGIKGTEPLHWDGDMETFDKLVGEVFVKRMGGAPQSEARIGAMADWIEALEPHPPLRAADDFAALRGKELFESEEVGCASCHNGALLSNNQSIDVGTGGVFQVPSLVNVAYHRPWIHTGCADTLRERFDPDCGGGDEHGRTSQLSDGEIDDLVAYLESL
jgi:hypothetical protein